jgi:hypothetical protein
MAIPLRTDFDAAMLRAEARRTKHAGQARRLLALAAIYDGATRTEAAKIGGVTLQIVRDWVIRFNARGPEGLIDGKSPGQPSRCQSARKRDPRSASKRDPGAAACAGSPQGGPARRGVPVERLTQRRAGGACGPTGASRGRESGRFPPALRRGSGSASCRCRSRRCRNGG